MQEDGPCDSSLALARSLLCPYVMYDPGSPASNF